MRKTSLINYDYLWRKIREYARKAGRAGTKPIILLFYVLKSKDTPLKDKMAIVTSIAYVVLPIDLVSAKRLPVIGWIDEVVSVAVAYDKLCKYITTEMRTRADKVLDRWFPDPEAGYVEYELIEE